MSLVELIGFLVSFLALILIGMRSRAEARRRQEHPEEFVDDGNVEEEDMDDPINSLLKSMEREKKKPPIPPNPPIIKPKVVENQRSVVNKPKPYQGEGFSDIEQRRLKSSIEQRKLTSKLESHRLHSSIEGRQLQPQLKEKSVYFKEPVKQEESRGAKMINNISSLKDMVIYKAILDKPKGFDGF